MSGISAKLQRIRAAVARVRSFEDDEEGTPAVAPPMAAESAPVADEPSMFDDGDDEETFVDQPSADPAALGGEPDVLVPSADDPF